MLTLTKEIFFFIYKILQASNPAQAGGEDGFLRMIRICANIFLLQVYEINKNKWPPKTLIKPFILTLEMRVNLPFVKFICRPIFIVLHLLNIMNTDHTKSYVGRSRLTGHLLWVKMENSTMAKLCHPFRVYTVRVQVLLLSFRQLPDYSGLESSGLWDCG